MPKSAVYFVDGGARGNPGESGSAAVEIIGDEKKGYYSYKEFSTNNEAEYQALLMALDQALKKEIDDVQVYTDSELVCRQIKGEYKVKSDTLKVFHKSALDKIKKIKTFKINHIPRSENKEADELANLAMNLKENGER